MSAFNVDNITTILRVCIASTIFSFIILSSPFSLLISYTLAPSPLNSCSLRHVLHQIITENVPSTDP